MWSIFTKIVKRRSQQQSAYLPPANQRLSDSDMADGPQSDDLRNIIRIVRKPRLTKVDSVPPDEHCCICLRDFSTPPDLVDDEPPCQPMQLHPCGHFVGDTCHAKLERHHKIRCLLCTRDITCTTPVPTILSILCKMDHLGTVFPVGLLSRAPYMISLSIFFRRSDFPVLHILEAENELTDLQARLFHSGPYTRSEALQLWRVHLNVVFEYMNAAACVIVISYNVRLCVRFALRLVLEFVSPDSLPFAEYHDYLRGLMVGSVIPFAAVILFIWNNDRRLAPIVDGAVTRCALICIMAFEYALTANTKKVYAESGLVAATCFLFAPFVLYAVFYALLTGWLIYLGWRHRT